MEYPFLANQPSFTDSKLLRYAHIAPLARQPALQSLS